MFFNIYPIFLPFLYKLLMPQFRQLAAIMFTDIVGYTALTGEDEQEAFEPMQKPILQQPIKIFQKLLL